MGQNHSWFQLAMEIWLLLMLWPLSSVAQVSTNLEAISREVSLYNLPHPAFSYEAISREVSLYNLTPPVTAFEAISREVSVYNLPAPATSFEAISREVSVYNLPQPSVVFEAISREVSVYNLPQPANSFEAISREISVFLATNLVPDLAATILGAPSSAIAGTTIQISYSITNRGPVPAIGPWTDQVLLSVDTNGVVAQSLGTEVFTNTIEVASSVTLTQAVTLPLSGYGSYFLGVRADSAGILLESNEGNNTALQALSVLYPPLPDVVVAGLAVTNAALGGQLVSVSWTVTNAGTAAATAPWQETLLLADNEEGRNATALVRLTVEGSLNPNDAVVRSQAVILPAGLSGNYWLVLRLDSASQLIEGFGETNNYFVAPLPTAITSPDLEVSLLTSAAWGVFGRSINVTWAVRNAGNGPALGSWNDRVWLSSASGSVAGATLLASVAANVSPLPSSASYSNGATVTVPLTSQSQTGAYWLVVQADGTGVVAESNEGNNLRSVPLSLTLPPLPDLVATNVSSPAVAFSGQSIPVSWTVTNSGAAAANGVWLESIKLVGDEVTSLTNAAEIQSLLTSAATIATFSSTNSLAPNGFVTRTQQVTIPSTGVSGPLRLVVQVDAGGAITEESETNNFAVATNTTLVPAALTLYVPVTNIAENAASPTIQGLVARNGSLASNLVVSLASGDTNELTTPGNVTIPAGQASASFALTVQRDLVVDADKLVTVTATASNYLTALASVTVVNSDLPRLTLVITPPSVAEGLTVSATVTRDGSTNLPLLVQLNSSSAANLQPPSSITIPPGTNSWMFAILAGDDSLVESSHSYTVNASASGYASASASVSVTDNDVPALMLALDSASISEGAGAQATHGTITRSTNGSFSRALVVLLSSGNTNTAIVPASVTIGAYQSSARFPIAAVNNALVDGPKTATLYAFATETSSTTVVGSGASTNIVVTDDDGPTLKLIIARKTVAEGLNPATTATVSRNTLATNDVFVTLRSSDTNEATVPLSLVLSNGVTNLTFNLASVADGITDGSKLVTVTASATNFTDGSDTFTVTDIDMPDLVIARITPPAGGFTEQNVNINFRVENHGLATSTNAFKQRVFVSKDPYIGDDTLVGDFQFSGSIPPGLYFEQSIPYRLPRAAGDYWVVVTADIENSVAENDEDNNTLISATPIHVTDEYTATVQTDVTTLLAGVPVPLYGTVTMANGLSPEGRLVNIHITVREFKRVISALADATGHFAATFTPLLGEAGHYTIGAAHPGESSAPVQDEFTILGMKTDPAGVTLRVLEGGSISNVVKIQNLSEMPLTGITATLSNVPSNLQATANVSSSNNLASFGELSLVLGLAANNASIPQSTLHVRLASAEGVQLDLPVTVNVESLRPRLVAYPSELVAGMARGRQRAVEFEVVNEGGAPTGPLNVLLPAAPWLHLASTNPMPSLAPNETNKVTLLLTPADDLPLGPYPGNLALNGSGVGLSVPFNFRALSEAKGDLKITAVDEYTFFAEGSPRVTNATVTLSDAVTRQVVTNGATDANGEFFMTELPEGYYELRVSADKHSAFQATKLFKPGITNDLQTFLSRQTVRYVWHVEEVEFEDTVRINVETIFESFVPTPVVTLEPAAIDLSPLTEPGQSMQVELKISNHGLIAANHGRLRFTASEFYDITALIQDVGTLPALSSVVVPITVSRTGGAVAKARRLSPNKALGTGDCIPRCDFTSDVQCGGTLNESATSLGFYNGALCQSYTLPDPPPPPPPSHSEEGYNLTHTPIAVSNDKQCDNDGDNDGNNDGGCPMSGIDDKPRTLFVGKLVPLTQSIQLTTGASSTHWNVVQGSDLVQLDTYEGPSVSVGARDFNKHGTAVITATYSSGPKECKPATFFVRVVQFKAQAQSKWPEERERTRIGVAEKIDCSLSSPLNVTWSITTSGEPNASSLLDEAGKTSERVLKAGYRADSIEVIVRSEEGDELRVPFTVKQPESVFMKAIPSVGKYHNHNSYGIGLYPAFCIVPNDVSFENLEFGEGDGPWTGSGFLGDFTGKTHNQRNNSPAGQVGWRPATAGNELWPGYKGGLKFDEFILASCADEGAVHVGSAEGIWGYYWRVKGASDDEAGTRFDTLHNEWSISLFGFVTGRKYGSYGTPFEGSAKYGDPTECPSDADALEAAIGLGCPTCNSL